MDKYKSSREVGSFGQDRVEICLGQLSRIREYHLRLQQPVRKGRQKSRTLSRTDSDVADRRRSLRCLIPDMKGKC